MKIYHACDIPAADESYFMPWTLEMLYSVEPRLRRIAERTISQRRRRVYNRLKAYSAAKHAAEKLVGWGARDPRLRSSGAWDCYFNYILDELNL